jgi:hypothetical protein
MSLPTSTTRFNLVLLLLHSILLTTVLAKTPDFARCERILNETGEKFLWTGHPRGLTKPVPTGTARLYTYEGCLLNCGDGYEIYPWSKIADTITTWVLPSVGLLLQAPWESNVPAWRALLLVFRWIGNPIASLTCTLWNISVSPTSPVGISVLNLFWKRAGSVSASVSASALHCSLLMSAACPVCSINIFWF